jgi:hypothetical protein
MTTTAPDLISAARATAVGETFRAIEAAYLEQSRARDVDPLMSDLLVALARDMAANAAREAPDLEPLTRLLQQARDEGARAAEPARPSAAFEVLSLLAPEHDRRTRALVEIMQMLSPGQTCGHLPAGNCGPHEEAAEVLRIAREALADASTAPTAEPERHERVMDDGVAYCGWTTEAGTFGGCGSLWPCPTAQARGAVK